MRGRRERGERRYLYELADIGGAHVHRAASAPFARIDRHTRTLVFSMRAGREEREGRREG
jgi:hypothetical protein